MSIASSIRSLLRKSAERSQFVKEFNELLQNAYSNRDVPILCNVSITDGCSDFQHPNSAFSKSGLKIEMDCREITDSDKRNVSQMVLSVKELIQVLISLKFDTLIVGGKDEKSATVYCLIDYLKYDHFTF